MTGTLIAQSELIMHILHCISPFFCHLFGLFLTLLSFSSLLFLDILTAEGQKSHLKGKRDQLSPLFDSEELNQWEKESWVCGLKFVTPQKWSSETEQNLQLLCVSDTKRAFTLHGTCLTTVSVRNQHSIRRLSKSQMIKDFFLKKGVCCE